MSNYINDSTVKKRKPAPCIWCGETIQKGETAIAVTFSDNGEIDTCYWHPECSEAHQAMMKREKSWGEPFEPYGFARGSDLCKSDYRIMQEREQARTKD